MYIDLLKNFLSFIDNQNNYIVDIKQSVKVLELIDNIKTLSIKNNY